MSLYAQRGVSAQKEDVHAAIRQLDAGLFKNAFCKIYPDILGGDADWVNVMHADGAGTKSILAYLYWKETGDASVWKGIAQDAIVMNLDDLLCVGIHDNLVFNSTIDRNKRLIPGEVLTQLIEGSREFFEQLSAYGVRVHYLGGETADVGDVVRTIAVNGTMTCRWPINKLITNDLIREGDVIVGLAGFGQTIYESSYNSGIGSNGLTSARHDVLEKKYAQLYPESFDGEMPQEVAYAGNYQLTDSIQINGYAEPLTIGKLLLSPTRTFAPLLKPLLQNHLHKIHGLVHCSGGGQTKCLKYLPAEFHLVKDNLFDPPPVFELIQRSSGAALKEMYEVFNMGCRLEIYCTESDAKIFLDAAAEMQIGAQIIGRVNAPAEKRCLKVHAKKEIISY